MATSTYMAADNLSILIDYSGFKYTWYDPAPQVYVLSLSSNVSVHSSYYNDFTPLFCTDYVPYEDNIHDMYLFIL